MSEFSNRLKSLRYTAGITQQELADTINASRRAVIKWEQGKAQPSCDSIAALAVYFNVSADYLLGLTNQKKAIA